jgi:hypothetical protein
VRKESLQREEVVEGSEQSTGESEGRGNEGTNEIKDLGNYSIESLSWLHAWPVWGQLKPKMLIVDWLWDESSDAAKASQSLLERS